VFVKSAILVCTVFRAKIIVVAVTTVSDGKPELVREIKVDALGGTMLPGRRRNTNLLRLTTTIMFNSMV
jgi:hypothetical protein